MFFTRHIWSPLIKLLQNALRMTSKHFVQMLIILKKASSDPVKSLFVNILTYLLLFLLTYLQTLFIFLLTLLWLRWLMEQGLVWLFFLPHSHCSEWQALRNSKGSVGKTIEAFHGAQTATLSAKYFQTMTLKIPFHNCFPLQRETKPCLFSELHAEMRLPQQTGPSPEKTVCHSVTDVDKQNCGTLSNYIFMPRPVNDLLNAFVASLRRCLQPLWDKQAHSKNALGQTRGETRLAHVDYFSVLSWNEIEKELFQQCVSFIKPRVRGRTHTNLPSSLCVFITLESICLNLDDRNI